jgi:formylglycine-generating enzyme required for sulfatase activity
LAVDQLPAALKAVTFLRTDGSLPAAVAAEVHRIAADWRRRWFKRMAVAALVVVAVVAALYYSRDAIHRQPKQQIAGKDGAPAVLIPAGTFIWGDDENSPRRELFVDAFYLDKHEVTVGRYAEFLKQTGNIRPPEEWDTVDVKSNADLPVVGVDWHDANSYCQWVGRRLPTDAEWERAARGTDERKFPWGNDAPMAENARFGKKYGNPVYKDGVAAVGSHPKGASPFGVDDMSGNVGEWVADWFTDSFPSTDTRNPKGPASGDGKVLRGGGWYDPAERITATKRMHAPPEQRESGVGFRCASDAK